MTAIVDTSFLVSLINPREQSHQACAAVARSASERLILPQVVLPEATYLVDKYLGHTAMRDGAAVDASSLASGAADWGRHRADCCSS